MTTGQWFASHDGNRWWFDSGALCLDFAYTGGMGSNPEWERLHSDTDLGDWLAERFDRVDASAVTERDLADALALRSAVSSSVVELAAGRAPAPDDIDTINLFAATPNIPPVLSGGNRQAGRSAIRPGQVLSTIARDAIEIFSDHGHGRLRVCSADDCGLAFYDESRSNNRRWCSMQRCGNRSKVRAHRVRAHLGA